MRLPLLMRKIHKWLSLLIGLQLLFWIGGGLIMSYLPLDEIKAKHLIEVPKFQLTGSDFYPINRLIEREQIDASKVTLMPTYFGALYQVEPSQDKAAILEAASTEDVQPIYYDASSGELADELSEQQARLVAETYYKNEQPIAKVQLWDQPSYEYRGRLPVWRVDFDDSSSTTFYIDRHTGLISTARTTGWRVFDFVWMLHIMDYSDRTNFNTWWLVTFAFVALLFAISGLYILIHSLTKPNPRARAK